MPQGFFKPSALKTTEPASLVPKCGKCQLFIGCRSPKMEPSGKGRRRILIVGEAPGRTEDQKGRQFCGDSGKLLQHALSEVGINMRRDCWLTNSLICRPPDNATPTDKQLLWCAPTLARTIQRLQPDIILPFGDRALKQVLRGLWREDLGKIGRWVGWQIPSRKLNAWICPTWHPAYLLRNENDKALNLWFHRHLKRASKLSGKPWGAQPPPDLEKEVHCIFDTDEAARIIRSRMLLGDLPAAVDYETNMLKPDHDDAEIVCCSICWEGRYTIAYPWAGKAIEATREFLRSNSPKIASNMKFEQRWTMKHLGCTVRNWWWDTMQAAHVLDNREGITSIKFQAFVRLGLSVYDNHIKPYLKADGSNKLNRIREVDLKQLMCYCGLDSLIEYKVAMLQMQELGYGN